VTETLACKALGRFVGAVAFNFNGHLKNVSFTEYKFVGWIGNKCYHVDRIFFGMVAELTDVKDVISFFFKIGFQHGFGRIS
jgi:hypothetical protein